MKGDDDLGPGPNAQVVTFCDYLETADDRNTPAGIGRKNDILKR